MKNHGQGQEYVSFLIRAIGPRPATSPWAGI